MKKTYATLVLLCLFSICHSEAAQAQTAQHSKFKGFVSLGVGVFEALDSYKTADFRIEYRPEKPIHWKGLKPWIGAEATGHGTLWAGGGLLYDWNIAEKWHLIPQFGIGLYTRGNSERELDFPYEFRSQLELAYDLKNQDRIGLAFSHMSNAGLSENNPGTDIISLYYHFKL